MSRITARFNDLRALSSVGRASRLHRRNSIETRGFWPFQNRTERDSMANISASADQSRTTPQAAGSISGKWIYFIQAGENGPIKIGVTNDVPARLATHQISNHEELRVVCKIACEGASHERDLHRAFAQHHIRGEWFHPGPEIMRIVETHAAASRARASARLTVPA